MTFFESLLILMLAAIVLLQISRRLSLPYPALLAAAGVVVALIPGSPSIEIEPQTYLALFIAPVLVDAAYDFPPGAMRRYFGSLVVYAIVAVVLTAGVVAYLAHATLGMPIAAGIALGAVVAPPDAAAATAILRRFSLPLSTTAILQGRASSTIRPRCCSLAVRLRCCPNTHCHSEESYVWERRFPEA